MSGRPLISEMPWFVSDLGYSDAPRTVLAGTHFENRLVGVFSSPEEARALVDDHNAFLKLRAASAQGDSASTQRLSSETPTAVHYPGRRISGVVDAIDRHIALVRHTALSDAALLGVNPALVTDWFKLAAQDIVNGAELTGSAFDALIAKFPELAGVVKSFSEAVTVTSAQVEANYQSFLESRLSELTSERAEAESKLRAEYERTVSFIANVQDFLKDIQLDRDLSTLTNADRLAAAEKEYRETLALAQGGDRDAQEKLVSTSEEYLREARDFYATSEGYGKVYDEINASLKTTMAKAETELDVARRQASILSEIADGTKGLGGALKDYLAAVQKVLDQQKLVDNGRTFGANPERNRLIDAGIKSLGLNYTGNYGFQADGSDPFRAWREALPEAQLRAVYGVINQYIGINRASGGPVWGAGTSTSDSIPANLSNGEFVMREAAARSVGYGTMAFINRTGRLPDITGPRVLSMGNDNGAVVAAIERLERTSVQNAKAIGELQTALAQEDRRERRDQSDETERRRESSNRLAARRAQLAA